MKTFKTLQEQKEYLVQNKNIVNQEEIVKILKERPYVSIINPYKKLFYTSIENNIHKYEESISIMDYYKVATVDDLIAKELHYIIGSFERRVKGAIAYVISNKMMSNGDQTATSYIEIFSNIHDKNEEFTLLGFNDYKYSYSRTSKKLELVNERTQKYREYLLIRMASLEDNKKNKNNLFKKYFDNNVLVPFWLVVHTLSLGDILSIYEMLGKEMRNEILLYLNNEIENIDYNDTIFKFEDDLKIIKELRNVINHYEPLFEFIRSSSKSNLSKAINRAIIYSLKISNLTLKELLDNLPPIKNNDNNDTLEIYDKVIKTIKKRDD